MLPRRRGLSKWKPASRRQCGAKLGSMSPECPVCGRPIQKAAPGHPFPFCSARCKLIDLGRWLNEEYVVQPDSPSPQLAEPLGPDPGTLATARASNRRPS